MTDIRRTILWVIFGFSLVLLWDQWQLHNGKKATFFPKPEVAASAPASTSAPAPASAPAAASATGVPPTSAAVTATPGQVPSSAPAASAAPREKIEVQTDVFKLSFDTEGGSLVRAEFPKHRDLVDSLKNMVLLDQSSSRVYVAQTGLIGGDFPTHKVPMAFSGERSLKEGQNELTLRFESAELNGVKLVKTYTLKRGSYVIDVDREVANGGNAPWSASEYRQLQRTSPLVDRKFSFTNPEQYAFTGVSWYSPEERFQKLAFEDFADEPLNRAVTGGWIAQQQHYFFAAWLPPAGEAAQFSTAVVDGPTGPRYLVRAMAPAITVAAGESAKSSARLYVGPKLQEQIEEIAEGLVYTVDYGMVTFLAQPLFWALEQLHKLTGNWGFAIILITIIIKLAFFKLTEAQYKSFAKMRKLQPRLAALKERYGEDRQKMNQAMMELYQKEKINPLGGCLPILVQIPVFIALYWVLLESVELRQAPFIGWIQNLSDKDPYFILPILNGLAMYATQKLTPTAGMDPMQARIMQMMPVVFSIMFAFFPAGLVLYWTVNGALGLAQQYVITKRIEAGEKA